MRLLDAPATIANMTDFFSQPNIRDPEPTRANRIGSFAHAYAAAMGEVLAETLWPTRCALCDTPGETLCATCRRSLPFIDQLQACPRCGAPFGRVQCTECNLTMLAGHGRTEPSFDRCVSVAVFGDDTAAIVRTWKDRGERRLVLDMARLMAQTVPASWLHEQPTVSFVSASKSSLRKRGYDHGLALGTCLADELSLPLHPLLARPHSNDQRELSRQGRIANASGRFSVENVSPLPSRILMVDDVYTTGSTLFAACDALRTQASERTLISCVTFARVW